MVGTSGVVACLGVGIRLVVGNVRCRGLVGVGIRLEMGNVRSRRLFGGWDPSLDGKRTIPEAIWRLGSVLRWETYPD